MSAYVADADGLSSAIPTSYTLPRLQWAPPQEVPLWDISNCILEDGQILISPEEEVPTLAHTHLSPNHMAKQKTPGPAEKAQEKNQHKTA